MNTLCYILQFHTKIFWFVNEIICISFVKHENKLASCNNRKKMYLPKWPNHLKMHSHSTKYFRVILYIEVPILKFAGISFSCTVFVFHISIAEWIYPSQQKILKISKELKLFFKHTSCSFVWSFRDPKIHLYTCKLFPHYAILITLKFGLHDLFFRIKMYLRLYNSNVSRIITGEWVLIQ